MSGTMSKTLRVLTAALALGLAGAARAQAQNAVIRGTVVSDAGQPIGGANVYIAELGVAAATTDNGRYALTIAGERVRNQQLYVRVRAIGFRPNSRLVTVSSGEQTVDFTMATDINRLDEIVVTGVLEGTEAGKVPFAVSRVDVADIPVPAVDPLRMLVGRVPGANIVSFNGQPGAAPAVILRGPTSMNATGRSQSPMYIVDGVILNGDLPDLNPNDIENVEVVKGAAASSLYGARAGNGVIQITTRTGRRSRDGMSYTFSTEYGQNDIENSIELARTHALMMNEDNTRFCTVRSGAPLCANNVDWLNEAYRMNNAPGDFALAPAPLPLETGSGLAGMPLRMATVSTQYPGRIYDPVQQAVTPGPFANTSLDATGRFANTQVFTSFGYQRQAGALRFLEGYTRYSARLNVDQRLGEKWNASMRTYYANSSADGYDQLGQNAPLFFGLTRIPAIVDILRRDTLGRLYVRPNIQNAQNGNPLINAESQTDILGVDRFIGGLTLRYAPIAWADFEVNGSYDFQNQVQDRFRDKGFRTTAASPGANNGDVRVYEERNQSYNIGLNATLRRRLSQSIQTRWNFRALYGRQDQTTRQAGGSTLSAVGVPIVDNAAQSTLFGTSSIQSTREMGANAGVNIDISDGRYVIEGLIRRDGTSLFGSENRWATFGRVSASWRPSAESWWFGGDAVNDFRLRFSRGSAGGRPRFSAQYETFTITASGALNFGNQGNKFLKPEITVDNELGADFELFRRVGVQLTHAFGTTRDQILPVPVPAEKGFGTQWRNAGTLSNKTWELSVNLPVITRRNLNWNWRFTYDRTRTMVDALGVPPLPFGAGTQGNTTMFLLQPGERYGTFYGHKHLTSCSELPPAFQTDCGGPTTSYQINDDGYLVWVGAGNSWRDGVTNNLYTKVLPASATSPWGIQLFWGMPMILRDTLCFTTPSPTCGPRNVALGNALPDYQFAFQQNLQYRRLSVFALAQGVMGRDVFNEGRHWSHLDFLTRDLEQGHKTPETAKPIGYFWRTGPADGFTGVGGFYDQLGPTNYTVEDGSFVKLRELSVSYNVGRLGGMGDWTVSVIGRNLFTMTNYQGFDPEVGRTGGEGNSGVINAVDAFLFPNTRSFTFRLSSSF